MKKFWIAALVMAFAWAATTVAKQRIVIIGDSTVCNYNANYYPQTGWGQVLGLYFANGSVEIINKAIGGRSSRSFYTGQWDGTKALLQSGDILMIQFGHNDRDYSNAERYTDTNGYKMYLGKYVTEARALGVHPVFVTPMNMNSWTNATTVREVFCEANRGANYRGAMLRVADSLKVPVLDLEKKSRALMESKGQAYMARFHFLGLDVGEYPNFPNGNSDGTHFQELGALENARMITEEIARQGNDSILSLLAPKLIALHKVEVRSTLQNGGDTITHTYSYPPGATVTMKVKPVAGHTFLNWANVKGESVGTAKRYTFTQGTSESVWYAVFQGGGAIVPPQPEPEPVPEYANTLQGESFCTAMGALESSNTGFKGAGYLNYQNSLQSGSGYVLTAKADETVSLRIRYANGGTTSRPMAIAVNGITLVDSLDLPSTGSWTNWDTLSVNVAFAKGRDSLTLVSLSNDGGPNLDQLSWASENLDSTSCLAEIPSKVEPRLIRNWNGFQSLFDLKGRRTAR